MKVLNFKQELTGAFGKPIAENPTQVMIEAAYRHHGLDWRYLTIEVAEEDLETALKGARAMGFRGLNCTLPHKVNVIRYLDGLGQSAAVMEAVNCIVPQKDGRWIGENTDGKGFLQSLKGIVEPKGRQVVIFGAGGAARAIGVELALAGAKKITIVNRSRERGQALAGLIRDRTPAAVDFAESAGRDFVLPNDTDIFVNATNIGLFPDINARVPVSGFRRGLVVADVIPNPPRTRLVQEAEAAGCTVLDGLGMLVNQGVIGIRLWTGVDPDPKVMRAALEAVFTP